MGFLAFVEKSRPFFSAKWQRLPTPNGFGIYYCPKVEENIILEK
jgi:hypothetical protein